MRKRLAKALFAALAVLALTAQIACSTGGATSEEQFRTVTPSDMAEMVKAGEGKVHFFIFWATWCPACRQELPELEKLRDLYSEEELEIAAVSLDDKKDALEKYFADGLPGYPVYLGTPEVGREFKVSSIPHLLVYNKKGEVVFSRPGAYPVAMLDVLVRKLVDE